MGKLLGKTVDWYCKDCDKHEVWDPMVAALKIRCSDCLKKEHESNYSRIAEYRESNASKVMQRIGFPINLTGYTWDDYKLSNGNQFSVPLKIDDAIMSGKSIFLHSENSGVGKTRSACASVHKVLVEHPSIPEERFKFITERKFVERHNGLWQNEKKSFLDEFYGIRTLIIDELGWVMDRDKNVVVNLLFERYENNRQTIITTHLSPESLAKMFGNSIYSRYREAIWISFKGKDMRAK